MKSINYNWQISKNVVSSTLFRLSYQGSLFERTGEERMMKQKDKQLW